MKVLDTAAGYRQRSILEKGEQSATDVRLLRTPPEDVEPREEVLALARRLAPTFYLDTGNVCNQRCIYCGVPRNKLYRTTKRLALSMARKPLSFGWTTCTLIGGEPTIWPPLLPVLDELTRRGLERVILTTNGLMLSYKEFLDKLMERHVDLVALSFDDFDPKVQAVLSGNADTPKLVERAVDNLAAAEIETCFYSVVTKFMRERSAEFASWALSTASRFRRTPSFFFAALKPDEEAFRNWDTIGIPLSLAALEVEKVVLKLRSEGLTAAVRDFPLCLLTRIEGHSMDLYHEHGSLDLRTGNVGPAPFQQSRGFAKVCERCQLKNWCPGVHKAYLEKHGAKELSAYA